MIIEANSQLSQNFLMKVLLIWKRTAMSFRVMEATASSCSWFKRKSSCGIKWPLTKAVILAVVLVRIVLS